MKMRRYSYDIGNYIFIKEISASFFNNYLVFDATTIVKKDNMGDDDKVNYFSLFMIFGYPNGTIITKDITKILSGSANYDSSINFVNFLYEDIVIDNNIFGYIPDDKTIITSIPNEISIINPIDETPIEANTIIYNSQNYAIKQKTDIEKTDQYYYIEFQSIIREPSINDLYTYTEEVKIYPSDTDYDFDSEYEPKTFYGKN